MSPTPAPASSRISDDAEAARLEMARVLVTAPGGRARARPRGVSRAHGLRARARRPRQAPVRLPHRHPPRARRAHPRDRVRSRRAPDHRPARGRRGRGRVQARARRPPRGLHRRVWNAPMRVPASVRGGDGSCPAPPPRPLRRRRRSRAQRGTAPAVRPDDNREPNPSDVLDHRTPTEDEPPREHEPSSRPTRRRSRTRTRTRTGNRSRATRLRVARGTRSRRRRRLSNRILLSTIQSRGCPPAIAWISNWRLFSVARRTGVSTAWTTREQWTTREHPRRIRPSRRVSSIGSVVLGRASAWDASEDDDGDGDDGDARARRRASESTRASRHPSASPFAKSGGRGTSRAWRFRARVLSALGFDASRDPGPDQVGGDDDEALALETLAYLCVRLGGVALGDAHANADVDERARAMWRHVDASLAATGGAVRAAGDGARRGNDFAWRRRIATCSLIVAFYAARAAGNARVGDVLTRTGAMRAAAVAFTLPGYAAEPHAGASTIDRRRRRRRARSGRVPRRRPGVPRRRPGGRVRTRRRVRRARRA